MFLPIACVTIAYIRSRRGISWTCKLRVWLCSHSQSRSHSHLHSRWKKHGHFNAKSKKKKKKSPPAASASASASASSDGYTIRPLVYKSTQLTLCNVSHVTRMVHQGNPGLLSVCDCLCVRVTVSVCLWLCVSCNCQTFIFFFCCLPIRHTVSWPVRATYSTVTGCYTTLCIRHGFFSILMPAHTPAGIGCWSHAYYKSCRQRTCTTWFFHAVSSGLVSPVTVKERCYTYGWLTGCRSALICPIVDTWPTSDRTTYCSRLCPIGHILKLSPILAFCRYTTACLHCTVTRSVLSAGLWATHCTVKARRLNLLGHSVIPCRGLHRVLTNLYCPVMKLSNCFLYTLWP